MSDDPTGGGKAASCVMESLGAMVTMLMRL